jgi:hypothetical protein
MEEGTDIDERWQRPRWWGDFVDREAGGLKPKRHWRVIICCLWRRRADGELHLAGPGEEGRSPKGAGELALRRLKIIMRLEYRAGSRLPFQAFHNLSLLIQECQIITFSSWQFSLHLPYYHG